MPSSTRKRGREKNAGNEEDKESAKRSSAATTPAEDDGDWRRPLFYWKGNIELSPKQLTWKGSWVSDLAEHGVPEDFESTRDASVFELVSSGKLYREEEETVAGLRGRFKGHYLLDQGEGPGRYQDRTHHFAFDSSKDEKKANKDGYILVAASGTTEFGNFVSAGYVKDKVLILARRYIGDTDKCNKWRANPRKVLEWCLQQEGVQPEDENFWTRILPQLQLD